MLNLQQRGDKRVTLGLLDYPLPGIDQDQGQIGGRGSRDHISGILYMPRSISNDEFAFRCGKIAVGHIDGDPLLPLVFQAIGKMSQLQVTDSLFLRDFLQIIDLILINRLGVK